MQASFSGTAQANGACPELDEKTVRWIVPSRPGGGYDTYSRLLQPFLEQRLSVRLVIENVPDAGGIVGAIGIRDARADGTTLGIVNAPGLLTAHAVEGSLAPDPLTEFTLLGQVVGNHMVMFTGRDSGLHNIADLLRASQLSPIVVGVRDVGSASFYAVPVTARLLGMNYVLVSGYVGSPARTLAVMRGEVDIVLSHFDSVEGQVKAGELVPLLQLSGAALSDFALPQLGGPDGVALQRASFTGKTQDQAGQEAADLAAIIGAGRLVVGPPGLNSELSACLAGALGEILQGEELERAAGRAGLSIEYAGAAEVHQSLLAAARGVEQFNDLIRAAVAQARE